jgi:hypothetical protein
MSMCRPVYPSACLDVIEAAGKKPKPLSDAIANALNTDAGLQAIIKQQTGIDFPYNIGNLSLLLANKTVQDEIRRRTQDTYFSLTRP